MPVRISAGAIGVVEAEGCWVGDSTCSVLSLVGELGPSKGASKRPSSALEKRVTDQVRCAVQGSGLYPRRGWEAWPAEAWREMLWQGLGPDWTGLPAWVGGILGGEPMIEANSTASQLQLLSLCEALK